ncbi:MAG: DUF1501 domain-containing protein [Bryobacteraceae bacterium]
MTRRQMLATMGCGFGNIGWAAATGKPHFAPRAKHVIFLFLNGGPSHIDTFDPKPELIRMHGKPMPRPTGDKRFLTGKLLGSPFQFRKHGQSGADVSEIFPKVAGVIDEFCVIRSMYTDAPSHEQSLLMMNTGVRVVGRPSMGSWMTYGLGTENQNLPGFVVLCPGVPVIGPQLWSSAFLPAANQGAHIPTNEKEIDKLIPFIRNRREKTAQRLQIDLLADLNRQRSGATPEVESSIRSMETAFQMQSEAPDVFDIEKESEATRARYGTGDFGRGCLMALRLVERGVRVVQIYYGNVQPWDSHVDIQEHRKLALQSDGPIAALVQDLKSRGLLDETMVLVGGEFGRTPAVELRIDNVSNGRDHNHEGFTYLVAGGGVKRGLTYGSTDEFGQKAVENPVHPHDLHATVLHQFGIDHTRLTYRYSGRDFRLTDVEGKVVKDILA